MDIHRYKDQFLLGFVIILAIPFLFFSSQMAASTDQENGSNNDSSEESDDSSNKNSDESNGESDDSSGEDSEEGSDDSSGNNSSDKSDGDKNQNSGNKSKIIWGVDSASPADDNSYQCVVNNFGDPDVWGRYLGDREGISVGLSADEAEFLHTKDTKILIIYNHVNDATGYDRGVQHAEQAISFAKDIGVPEGVALFLDVEPSYPVDSAFMKGWYDKLIDSAYHPAVYGVFNEGSALLTAFTAMEQDIQENIIVWTAHPQEGIAAKENAPEFNPQGPDHALMYGWQYGLEAETCHIDTNLFQSDITDFLW